MPDTNCARFDGYSIAISLAHPVSQSVRARRLPPRLTHRSLPELVREELSAILLVNEAGTLKATRASARDDHNPNRDHEWCHSAQARKRLAGSWSGRSVTLVLQEGHARARPSSLSA